MNPEIIWRYIHFLSIFSVFGALVGQHLLLKSKLTRQEISRLATIDLVYGLSAITLVAAGLMLWLAVGKPADFYTNNWIFLLKVGLAIFMGLLSLIPTIFFLKNRKGEDSQELINIPSHLIMIVRIELLLLLLIPFCAVLMAKGIGLSQ